jgi:hypothetical protein
MSSYWPNESGFEQKPSVIERAHVLSDRRSKQKAIGSFGIPKSFLKIFFLERRVWLKGV